MPAPQELILSGCSSEQTATTLTGRAGSTPSLHLHDLLSSAHLQAFKTTVSGPSSVSYTRSQGGSGGAVFAVQEGKALVNIWAWQKDQLHLKLHLPEKLSCFSVSPNGCWAAGGSTNGQIYLWELGSGLLLASFTAHYRAVTSLTFTSDCHLLLSGSLDSSVHVYLVSRLVDEDGAGSGSTGKPYGTLRDHTLGIRAVEVGRTAGSAGGRCWTASDDGTVKMWSLYPPFDLLCSFSFPPSVIPTTITVDPTERFFYVGSAQGDVYHIPLFRRRAGLGERDIEAVGGGEAGAPPVKADGAVLSVGSPITALTLSLSSTHLLLGTHSGEIHLHSLPSHQHLRNISAHAGPITHLSTLLRPPDLVGTTSPHSKADDWPIMEIKPFERMRAKAPGEAHEVSILLRPRAGLDIQTLRPSRRRLHASAVRDAGTSDELAAVRAENKRLRAGLDRAVKINERMWNGIVDMKLVETEKSST